MTMMPQGPGDRWVSYKVFTYFKNFLTVNFREGRSDALGTQFAGT